MTKPFYRKMLSLGYTPAEFAKKIGVSHQTVYNWKLGRAKPRPRHLRFMSKLLAVPLDKLVDEFY